MNFHNDLLFCVVFSFVIVVLKFGRIFCIEEFFRKMKVFPNFFSKIQNINKKAMSFFVSVCLCICGVILIFFFIFLLHIFFSFFWFESFSWWKIIRPSQLRVEKSFKNLIVQSVFCVFVCKISIIFVLLLINVLLLLLFANYKKKNSRDHKYYDENQLRIFLFVCASRKIIFNSWASNFFSQIYLNKNARRKEKLILVENEKKKLIIEKIVKI